MMEYPEEKVYRDMERDGYNKLVARNVELEEANAQLLEVLEWLDTAIMPDERKYDRNGWGRIHKQTLREFDRKIKAAITTAKLEKER